MNFSIMSLSPLIFTACLLSGQAALCAEPKTHIEEAVSGRREYTVLLGGTLDGVNTRSPVGYDPWSQAFEPNLSVRMENTGNEPVLNPWVIVNGRRDWRTAEHIAGEAAGAWTSEKDKAIAVWDLLRRHRFHASPGGSEAFDPVKALNVYGYTFCAEDSQALSDLWRAAGLKTRRGFPQGHSTAEARFDGGFRLLDGDANVLCLLRDNETVASEAEIADDHDLMKRTHAYGVLAPDDRLADELFASLAVHDGPRGGEHPSHTGHAMRLVLRPGEALEWRWGNIGKAHGGYAGKLVANGKMFYAPALKGPAGRYAIASSENLGFAPAGASGPALYAKDPARPAHAVFKILSPYVIVGAAVRLTAAGPGTGIKAGVSFDGESYQPVQSGAGNVISLDPFIPPSGPARYSYFLKVELNGGAGLAAAEFDTDLQMAPLSLPALELGANKVVYTDDNAGPRAVRITHTWTESFAAAPPPPPEEPVFPADGASVKGTRFTFRWAEPEVSGSGKAADYHFQLSAYADLRRPLSPNFDKLVSRTSSKGRPEYELPCAGLLNPGKEYYWRVRALSNAGAWSAWSPAWRFTPRAPGVPVNLRVHADRGARTLSLTWAADFSGEYPARYKVYASDEKGFTASDGDYPALTELIAGKRTVANRPGNLLAETAVLRQEVAGPALALPNANKAHYRVVTVDKNGIESGPSAPASAPRAFIYTLPPKAAQTGRPFRYQVKAITSEGDLRSRSFGPEDLYNARFWDKDEPRFELLAAPEWLAIDPATGLISGTPSKKDLGTVKVRVLADIPKIACDTQEFELEIK